jgi:hypothetical protein
VIAPARMLIRNGVSVPGPQRTNPASFSLL